ncbi:unnamed protein product [Camellia sinensis]
MAYRGDLTKIGSDAFAILDQCMGQAGKHCPHPRPHQEVQNPHLYPLWVAKGTPTKEKVINCNQAAKKYGGVVIKDFGKKRHVRY